MRTSQAFLQMFLGLTFSYRTLNSETSLSSSIPVASLETGRLV